MARTAKAAQSSSGAKHVASPAPVATKEAGVAGGDTPITSESAILNTYKRIQRGRVGMWRGGGRLGISVSAPFVWRCLSGSAVLAET